MEKSFSSFRKADIFVYAAILLLVAALFFAFLPHTAAAAELTAIELRLSGEEAAIFTFEIGRGEYTVAPEYAARINVEQAPESDGGGLVVTYNDGAGGYNTIRILSDGEAYITAANCSLHRDCTRFPHITRAGMIVICVPHSLTLAAAGDVLAPEPITG